MISLKHLTGLVIAGFLVVGCAPTPDGLGSQPPINPNNVSVVPSQLTPEQQAEREAAERKRIREQKRREAAEAAKNGNTETTLEIPTPEVTPTPPEVPQVSPETDPKPKYRTAVMIPGKPGYVYNPWTNKAVDVRGIPSGELVRDPQDPNKNHIFRVP